MTRKLTITVDGEVYEGLHRVIGARRISRFLNDLARPHVTGGDLLEDYRDGGGRGIRARSAGMG